VKSASFSPDGRRILTAGMDKTAIVWNVSGRQVERCLDDHTGWVFASAFSPDGRQIVTSSRIADHSLALTVNLWDTSSGELLAAIGESERGAGTSAVAFSNDGRLIAAITESKTVSVWDAATHQELKSLRTPHEVYTFAFSPDGQHLVTAGAGEAFVWNVRSGDRLLTLNGGNQLMLLAAAYSPDGQTVVTAGEDRRIIAWNASSGAEISRLFGHRASIFAVAFAPDGEHLATASGDGTIKLWATDGVQNPRSFQVRTEADQPMADVVNMLVYSPDGKRVANTVADRTVRIWDVATGREILVLDVHDQEDEVVRIAFSPDGRRLATANGWHAPKGNRDPARIWDTATGRELLKLDGNGFVTFSPDGQRIATSLGNSEAAIWDAASGQQLLRLQGHTNWVTYGAFSPKGDRFATASRDYSVKVWNANTGRPLLTIRLEGPSWMVTYSPDGRRLAVLSASPALDDSSSPALYDSATGRKIHTLSGHSQRVNNIAFSPDGQRLVTSSYDRTAKIWDARTGWELLTLEPYTRMVTWATFSPDGQCIATGDYSGQLKFWQRASAAQVAAWDRENAASLESLKP
jgi:WD40 repeat protein